MSITHQFVNPAPALNDPNNVGSEDWNDDHNTAPFYLAGLTDGENYYRGAAVELLLHLGRHDLRYATRAFVGALVTNVAGNGMLKGGAQYSLDNAVWNWLSATTNQPNIDFGAVGYLRGPVHNIVAPARIDGVYLRLVTFDGVGTAFDYVAVQRVDLWVY